MYFRVDFFQSPLAISVGKAWRRFTAILPCS
jgi:hypothetical protein